MSGHEPTVQWRHRTAAGRTIDCLRRDASDGIDVDVRYDDTVVETQSFTRSDDAALWIHQQFDRCAREWHPHVQCPRCGALTRRSRQRSYERFVKVLTRRRPYRCLGCGWRGWRLPI